MRAIFVEEPDASITGAEYDIAFAQELYAQGGTTCHNPARQNCGNPEIGPQKSAHRRISLDLGQQIIFVARYGSDVR
jgi:hypothetical protein